MAGPRGFEAPEGPLTAGPSPGVGVRPDAGQIAGPVPEIEGRDFSVTRKDPRFTEVGDGYAHIMRPEVREASAREMAREREGRVGRLGSALAGVGLVDDPERGTAAAEALDAGVPASLMFGGQQEDAVNWREFTDAAGQVWQIHPRTGERRKLEGLTGPVPVSGSDGPNSERARAARDVLSAVRDLGPDPLPEDVDAAVAASPFGSLDEARSIYREFIDMGEPPPQPAEAPPPEPGPGLGARIGGFFRDMKHAASEAPEAQASPAPESAIEDRSTAPDTDYIRPGRDQESPSKLTPGPEEPLPQPRDAGAAPSPDATSPGAASANEQLRADISEALAEGHTAEQIISELEAVGAPPEVIEQARAILEAGG